MLPGIGKNETGAISPPLQLEESLRPTPTFFKILDSNDLLTAFPGMELVVSQVSLKGLPYNIFKPVKVKENLST